MAIDSEIPRFFLLKKIFVSRMQLFSLLFLNHGSSTLTRLFISPLCTLIFFKSRLCMFRTLLASCVTSCTRCIPLPPPNSPFPLLGSPCLQQQTFGIMPAYHRPGKGMVFPHQRKEHYIFTKTGQKHPLHIAYSEAKSKKKECLHISRPMQLKTSKIHFSGLTLTALNFSFSCP